MPSTSETGHAKNVANFQQMITFLTGYGTTYNPTKSRLKINALNELYTVAQAKLANVQLENTDYNDAVNERVQAFNDLRTLSTRLVNALSATDATREKIADAKGYNAKLQGKRAPSTTKTITDTNAPAPATISVSQQSFDQRIQHFAGLITVLQSEPSYSPNENELQIATLNAKKADLLSKNSAVNSAYAIVNNSRIGRDKTLYGDDEGLIDVAGEVKNYVKSVFGTSSPEYKQIKSIQFKKPKK